MSRRTRTRPREGPRTVHLPVLESASSASSRGPAARRPSTIGRWRAAALITVHILMAVHILHWWITGKSIGRFVLSDSMRTLEFGEINPGVLLFCAALLVTALFGRLMCGWVCHMGALQDACAWVLRRAGIRPRLFRSRLLGYVPLGLACYMFLWPTLEREVIAPAAAPAFPGFSAELATDDLWRDMPAWPVAVPFLLVCGVATVYFLGARGLCRYGCPYGGFLLPVEQLAVGRIVVDMSRCDQCGICTAACTTGVRVHDEVRMYGAVMDRNCVRSFDCIGACPQDALRFTLARPALLRRSQDGRSAAARPDLTLTDELLCLAVFLITFFVVRGLYELIPLLFAASLAVLAAFLAWKTRRVLMDPHVRLGRAQLRLHGRTRPAGCVFLTIIAALVALVTHSAVVRGFLLAASRHDDQIGVPYEIALAGDGVLEADRAEAAHAQRLYALARPFWHGGIALAATPSAEFRLAWVTLVVGDKPGAVRVLRDLAALDRAGPNASTELARLLISGGHRIEAISLLETTVERHPRWAPPRDMLAFLWVSTNEAHETARAEALYHAVLDQRPTDAPARVGLGRFLVFTGRPGAGLAELRRAAADWPRNPDVRRTLAAALFSTGQREQAITELHAAADAMPARRNEFLALARDMQPQR